MMKYLKLYESFKKRTLQDYLDECTRDESEIFDYNTDETLNCYDENLTSLKGVEKFKQLKWLICSDNKLTSLKELKNLNTLETLIKNSFCNL